MANNLEPPKRRQTLVQLIGASGVLAGAAGFGLFGGEHPAAEATSDVPASLPSRREIVRANHLPNVPLLTQEGREVRFYDDLVKGKTAVINFFYTLCNSTCPLSTRNLAEVADDLRRRGHRDVVFLSLSLAPEFDTPEVLKAYAEAHGAGSGWFFLTGRRYDIEQLRRSLGVYDVDPELDQDPTRHTGIAVIGNEPVGRWRAMPAMAHPVRVRQAIERVILPPSAWPDGLTTVTEVAYDDSAAVDTPVDPDMLVQLQYLASQR